MAHGLTYQSSTTSDPIELWRGYENYIEDVDDVPLRADSYDGKMNIASSGLYHNPDTPRYIWHQTVHNNVWEPFFNWEVEAAFEVQQFAAQFGERYLAGVTSLPSYDESRLLYGR